MISNGGAGARLADGAITEQKRIRVRIRLATLNFAFIFDKVFYFSKTAPRRGANVNLG